MPLDVARLAFDTDGTPVSEAYGDVYHSAAGGAAQARHVFLAGNGLPERWRARECFTLLETGFGLGLNFLATWMAWKNDPHAGTELHFVSLEKHPFTADDLAVAHAAWPEFSALAAELREHWPVLAPGEHRISLDAGRVILHLIFGNAVDTLSTLKMEVDAFYLDGFSPAKNPEMWSPELCGALANRARPGATLATWSVAGGVRQALKTAGFVVEKCPGFAGKRQMLVGHYPVKNPD